MYKRLPYFSRCVDWPRERLDTLNTLINDAVMITRRTFLQHVDREALQRLEEECGYDSHWKRGLTMAGDFHVSYHRYRDIYYFRWSAIEYVFATPKQILAVKGKDE